MLVSWIAPIKRGFTMRRASVIVLGLSLILVLVSSLCGRLPGQEPNKAESNEWEYRAVALGKDEAVATRKLNELAAEGWRYVGPLGSGLTAFKRLSPLTMAARNELKILAGKWKLISMKEAGKELLTEEFKPAFLIVLDDGKTEAVWPKTTQTSTITVDPSAKPKRMTRTLSTTYPEYNRTGIYKLKGNRLTLCLAPVGMDGQNERLLDQMRDRGFQTWDMALGVRPARNTDFSTKDNYFRLELYERVKEGK
jgi:uncharacterized protein (TIGR03067 family)